MSRNYSIPKVNKSDIYGGTKLVDVNKEQLIAGDKRPSLAITYMDVKKDYGLKYLSSKAKNQGGNRDIYKELGSFQEKVRQYKSIQELIDRHKPNDKLNNEDKKSETTFKKIQSEYKIDTSQMIHIHCCGGGSGAFVLHGFVLGSCFEIVWFDPLHEVHKL